MLTPTDAQNPSDQAPPGLVGFIHSTHSGGAVDGPGLRFVLFMSGCQMRCLYCHNPDTWDRMGGKPKTVDEVVAEIGRYSIFLKRSGGRDHHRRRTVDAA